MRFLSAAILLVLSAALSVAKNDVTFHQHVLPVLQKRCQGCHRPGEIAPMSFMTYGETRKWARSIREAVRLRKMPPWFADASHSKFENDRSLTSSEIETLVTWADTGAPEGDPKNSPEKVRFLDGWAIGKPDVVVEMPHEFEVPASGPIDYQLIAIPTGFTEDKWVETLEIRPSNRSVVHHVVVFAREIGSPYVKSLKPGIPTPAPNSGIRERAPDTGEGFFSTQQGREIMCTYVPGGEPCRSKPGQARLIKAGSDLVFEVHYTSNGKTASDRTKIGMVFAKQPPNQRVINMVVLNPNLRIPAGAASHRVDARVKLNAEATITSFLPHMHVRGKTLEYRVMYPSGESEILLNVPRYDFNWQLTYHLEKPRVLPKGTVIECTAYYDNSPNNPANPYPKSEVFWGDQTWEEMLAGFVDLTVDAKADTAELGGGKRLQRLE